jgi:cellulose synthase/poly-beta-1,6-N-acetylglucosamine synthase-like glycosyltransferase
VIYFCIPAHNEEQTVGVVLWKIRQVMLDFPRDYQILVADDASTDSTPANAPSSTARPHSTRQNYNRPDLTPPKRCGA